MQQQGGSDESSKQSAFFRHPDSDPSSKKGSNSSAKEHSFKSHLSEKDVLANINKEKISDKSYNFSFKDQGRSSNEE